MKRLLLTLFILLTTVITNMSWAQTVISGRILDDKGQGIPGAGVSVKGSPNIGTTTDVDGNYQLNVPAGATLSVQALGFSSQDVASGTAVVRMQSASRELSGAVVTALAIRREKRELGYSATTISSDELNAGNNVSALSAIQGKTAGVNITSTTGGPGGSTRVVLRGEKSVSGNNNALIVVDGIPVSNSNRLAGRDSRSQVDFGNRGNDVNPDDIENITVLKGPAAAALYGSAGANGAIMITTKSGRGRKGPNKNSISFQSTYTLSDVLKVPDVQSKYGQGDIHGNPSDRRENFSWGLPIDNLIRPWGQEINGQQKVKPYSFIDNNIRSFFDRGRTWENNASLSGASDQGSYYLALNTLNNKGVIPNNFYDRYGIRLNTSLNLPNKFYTNFNVNYTNIYSRVETSGQGNEGVINNILQQPIDIPIAELSNLDDPFNGYNVKDSLGVSHYGYYGAYSDNPYYVVATIDNRNRTDRVVGSAVIGFKPNSHWDIFNRAGADFVNDRATSKIPKYDLIPFDEFYYSGANPQKRTNNGGFFQSSSTNLIVYNDLIANYRKELSENITFSGLIGGNVQFNRATALSGSIDNQTNGLIIPDYYNLNNATGQVTISDQFGESRVIGLYGSANIGWKNQVFVDITGRNDWTSTLTAGNRSFFYPSTSVSWVFSELFKGSDFGRNVLNYAKIRASYASVGNGATAYQNNNAAYVQSSASTGFGTISFPFNGNPGFTYQNNIGNPALRPERTNAVEAGLELSLLKNRISFEATVYNNNSVDQILNVPTPPSTGFTSRVVNLGDITNKGVELSARITPVKTATGFTWELFGTYTKNTSEVVRLANGVNQVTLDGISGLSVTATVGKPYGAIYGIDLQRDPTGRVIVDSATGSPQLTPGNIYRGSFVPRFVASWGTTLRYKGLSFNVLFDTKQGGVFFSRTKDIMDFCGTAAETENREEQIFPNSVYINSNGDYVANTTQKYDPYDYFVNVIPSGQHIVDATYVKLREASLYYTLPTKWFGRTYLGGAQIGIFGNNLLIWTPESNKYSDPEQNSVGASNAQGFDFTSRPSLRNYGATIRVNF